MPGNYKPSPDHPLTTALPYFPPREREWLHRELDQILTGRLAMGPRVAAFESEFAAYCGAAKGVAFPSCTSALEASLLALGVGPGDEVLVPVETFVATGATVLLTGARPVFTEVAEQGLGMDFEDALAKVTERTRGAIVVHFGGLIGPGFPEFAARMREKGLFVLEDAAHAHGAELEVGGKIRRAGSLADGGCFSFFPTKIMTTGEGGMLVTDREDLAGPARSLQNRGRDMEAPGEIYIRPGRNNRFTEMAASMGLSQLRCLGSFLESRRAVARVYDQALEGSSFLEPVRAARECAPSYWRYPVLAREPFDRERLQEALKEEGISIDWAYFPALHLQPVFRGLPGADPESLPRSKDLLSRHICLPIHARLRDEDAGFVAERLLFHLAALGAG